MTATSVASRDQIVDAHLTEVALVDRRHSGHEAPAFYWTVLATTGAVLALAAYLVLRRRAR